MITRFAPSPTGLLHLGHAFSALEVWRLARGAGGTVLLRIEDVDSERCRPVYDQAIRDDLHWLGFDWLEPVLRQSTNLDAYRATLAALDERGLVYPCSCTRTDIAAHAPAIGWDGYVYPGTCRARPMSDRGPRDAVRLDLAAALSGIGPLAFTETGPLFAGDHRPGPADLLTHIGDPVLWRKTGDPAYHLACPHDDAAQGVTHVIRGADLWHATFLHVVLQAVMGWPTPMYHHHDLVRDPRGQRLAKIDKSRAIASYREEGLTPDDIWSLIGV
ncbi:tRNA glutamyl-Q(34) synthetase GluQRS [Maritimibacter sp. DP1N21-5]|uniref:tRNA glutamyl-Q(34) synthetase GluQRS n=1 Tax=Maritimibacter sp. DP1N21-5 TaxID=2836867 RepID=UPI001C43E823|nr:tRNA glutamyl-Q(34) synthetase GluQRS [Maritimibacter sp. DP1N21-5]MBV7409801.1 tRNA glutamyl-Q(34) synthetase GluQRS [Maritimibacter sp. DP1N21-5]